MNPEIKTKTKIKNKINTVFDGFFSFFLMIRGFFEDFFPWMESYNTDFVVVNKVDLTSCLFLFPFPFLSFLYFSFTWWNMGGRKSN